MIKKESVVKSHPFTEAQLIIWSLGNALLDGDVDHNTQDNIFPQKGVLDTILTLHRRGSQQAICSKNKYLSNKDYLFVHRTLLDYYLPTHLMDTILVNSSLERSYMIENICGIVEVDISKAVFVSNSLEERQLVGSSLGIHITEFLSF